MTAPSRDIMVATGQSGTRGRRIGAMLAVLLVACPAFCAAIGPCEWAYIRLDYTRDEKVRQLQRFCDNVHELARRMSGDEVMLEFFDVSRTYHSRLRHGSVPQTFTRKMTEFQKAVEGHYFRNYLCFHDLLLVDTSGDILYSLRREADHRGNLFAGRLARTTLAQRLRQCPQEEVFVPFHYYGVSGKPAAFFIEPVRRDGRHTGWFVLQCAVNKINSLFAGVEQLGQTGEAFLVNRDGYLLTESSFEGDATILKKHLDDRNVQAKFQQQRGRMAVTDYRGFAVLTSFEVFDFLDTRWLVVAKVDEAQVVTEHFKQHRTYYADRIARHLAELAPLPSGPAVPALEREIIRVDMDEFVRANHAERLETLGVSTCTAIIATYPGKFGYLAHVSPYDRLYGGDATNLLGHVLQKIKTFDIYKYERRRVRFIVVARHLDSMTRIVDKLVDEGFLLSQISMLYHGGADCANVAYDYCDDRIDVEWLFEAAPQRRCVHHADDAQNLGTIVKQYMDL